MTIVQKQFFQSVQLLSSQGQNDVKIIVKSLNGNCCVPLLLMTIDVIRRVMLIIVI